MPENQIVASDLGEWLSERLAPVSKIYRLELLTLIDEKDGTVATWSHPFPSAAELEANIERTTERHAEASDRRKVRFTLRAYIGQQTEPQYTFPVVMSLRATPPEDHGEEVAARTDDMLNGLAMAFENSTNDPLAMFIDYIKWEKTTREEAHRWDVEQERQARSEVNAIRAALLQMALPVLLQKFAALVDPTRPAPTKKSRSRTTPARPKGSSRVK